MPVARTVRSLGAIVAALVLATAAARSQQDLQLAGPEPSTVKLGGSAILQITWSGEGEPGEPELPAVDGLRFRISPPSQSTVQTFDGRSMRLERSVRWSVEVTPQRLGEFELPPLRVRIGGRLLETRRTRLRCVEDLVGRDRSYVAAGVLPPVVYVHQPVDAWIRAGVDVDLLQHLVPVSQEEGVVSLLVTAEWFDDFPAGVAIEPKDGQPPRERLYLPVNLRPRPAADLGREERKGVTMHAVETRRRFLPSKPGDYRLEGPQLKFQFTTRYGRDLFGDRVRTTNEAAFTPGEAITLRVLPLPEKDRPADFRNAVGQLRGSWDLARRQLKVGDSVKLTLRLTGEGNFEFLEVPALDGLKGFHLYGQSVERGERDLVATYDLAPLEDRLTELPGISLPYFDPSGDAPSYKRLDLPPIPVTVAPLAKGETLAPLPGSSAPLTPGVDDIWDRIAIDGPPPRRFAPRPWQVAVAMLAPIAALGLGAAFLRRRRFLRDNPTIVRQRRAAASFGERLEREGALRAFSLYLAERLGWDDGAAVRADLEPRLVERGVPAAEAARCAELLARLQASRYSGRGEDVALAQTARELVAAIEREVRS